MVKLLYAQCLPAISLTVGLAETYAPYKWGQIIK